MKKKRRRRERPHPHPVHIRDKCQGTSLLVP
jgi:hypothetical protein